MLQIYIPNNNIAERSYCIKSLIGDFLGLSLSLHVGDYNDYTINLQNSKKLIIKDHFFGRFPKDLEYLNPINLPTQIKHGNYQFLATPNIPILYGDIGEINNDSSITLNADVFAGAFLMLSRWEEYVQKYSAVHNRFPARESIAFRFDFLNRPIVNEYVELLWAILHKLDPSLKRKTRSYRLLVSCDVDFPYDNARQSLSLTLKRSAQRCIKSDLGNQHYPLLNYLFGAFTDKFDLFSQRLDWIMTINESLGNIVSFNFMPFGTDTTYDPDFKLEDPRVTKIIQNVASRGHEIGFHPGYLTSNSELLFKKSLSLFKDFLSANGLCDRLKGGRQHFLRWTFPETLKFWTNSKLNYDSTLGYAEIPGFRCGTCYEFSLFDVLDRETLNLLERPLVLMECSVLEDRYLGLGRTSAAWERMLALKETCRKYSGDFTLLWHNSAFHTKFDEEVYKELIS